MAQPSEISADVGIKSASRDIGAWWVLTLMKRMLNSMGFHAVASPLALSQPGLNRGYSLTQLIEKPLNPSGVMCAALSTSLHGQVLAVNAFWYRDPKQDQLLLDI